MRLEMTGKAGAFSVLLLLAMAPAAQAQPSWWGGNDNFKPQPPAVEQSGRREWTWQGGNALSYGGPGKLRYEPGGAPRIIVTGDPAIVETIEVSGGDIRRRDTPGFFNFGRGSQVEILVRGVTLDSFTLSGSAAMELGRLQRDKLSLRLNGSGSLNAQGQARSLSLQVNGSGNANLGQLNTGTADIALNGSGEIALGAVGEGGSLRLTGSGKADLGDVGKSMGIIVTGSGDANLGRVDTINARLTGSGTVRLKSPPRSASYDIHGSGRVLAVGPDGRTTELARMKRPNEDREIERAQRERDRAMAQAQRERDRQQAREERERERAQDRAEREREREEARRERDRERRERD